MTRPPHPNPVVEAVIQALDDPEHGWAITKGWVSIEDAERVAAAVDATIAGALLKQAYELSVWAIQDAEGRLTALFANEPAAIAYLEGHDKDGTLGAVRWRVRP